MKKKKTSGAGNLYALHKDLDFYKQSLKASEHIIQEGSLGLSSKGEEAYKRLMKAFTMRGFRGVNIETGEEVERNSKVEIEALYGEETGKTILSIPRLQFRKESDLVRLLTGREEGALTGSDYRDYKAIKEELQQSRKLLFIEKHGIYTDKMEIEGQFFAIETAKLERTRETETGEQEVLFQEESVIVTIINRVLIHEIAKKGNRLPVDSTQLLTGLKPEQKPSNRQKRLIDYFTVYYEKRHSFSLNSKKVSVKSFTEEELFKIMRVSEKDYKGENRNRSRAMKELSEALKLCEMHERIEKISHSKTAKTVKVFFKAP